MQKSNKLVSFVIPCYNSEEYMQRALEALLDYKEIEIIIVNDGSTDNTLKIAKKYQAQYKNQIIVIDKENGGHGSGINAGLKVATGKYFKVLDSDDWVDSDNLKKALQYIRSKNADMYIFDYVYEKEGEHPKVMGYKNLPEYTFFTWKDIKKFKASEYLLMHSVVYKTSILRDIKLTLPEHTFYVDNIFVYYPLPFIHKMYYCPFALYHYYIGRSDQSVNENVMKSRVDQQIFVTKTMIDLFDPYSFDNPNLQTYLVHYLDIMMSVSTILLQLIGPSADDKKKDLWTYLKNANPRVYRQMFISRLTKMPRFISIPAYHLAQKIYKFN